MIVKRVIKSGVRALALVALAVMTMTVPAEARRYAAIVVDHDTGKVIHSRSADTLVYPASLTKMMTLYMLFDAIDDGRLRLDSKLKVSRRASGMPASRLGLKRGSTIRVEDAIRALVTKSANDVAVVVAEALAESEIHFAVAMTKKARALGMSKTTFKNASGLPNRHQKTTARDMAKLAQRLLTDHADRYHYFSEDSFRYNGRTYRGHNKLMRKYKGMDGLKTGYIRASGFNLAASAKRNGRRLITIVFGGRSAASRDEEVARLMDLGFSRLPKKQEAPLLVLGPPAVKPEPTVVQLASAKGVLDEPAASALASSALASPAMVEPTVVASTGDDLPVVMAPSAAGDSELLTPTPKPGLKFKAGDPKLVPQGKFGVQVGAFYDPDTARRAAYSVAQKLPALLLKGNVDVSALRSGRRPVYRARLVGFSRSDAEQACKALRRQKQDCLVLQTGPLQMAAR